MLTRDDFRQVSSRAALGLLVALLFSCGLHQQNLAQAQSVRQTPEAQSSPPGHKHDVYTPSKTSKPLETNSGNIVERAINALCVERVSDPLGSVPIDEMQSRPSLPLTNPEAMAGAQRAQRLLPLAKELAIVALVRLGKEYNLEEWRIRNASRRIQAVRKIEPDVELRDNASVILVEPQIIYFGTIFLAGLPSEEGMISVLAHELTHIADGRDDVLTGLFRQVGRRAITLTSLPITGRRPEELTCDWVGALAARAYIERTPNTEPLTRRLARLVEHNCVDEDDTDEDHLSPRNTMRALLAIDPDLARDILGNRPTTKPEERMGFRRAHAAEGALLR
jgi:hypothetical protein